MTDKPIISPKDTESSKYKSCRFWKHTWKYIGDPVILDGGTQHSDAFRYKCSQCGKIRDRK